jgi:hypothetical protein
VSLQRGRKSKDEGKIKKNTQNRQEQKIEADKLHQEFN